LDKKNPDVYNLARYYEIAFDFRDIPKQADFLEQIFEKFSGGKMKSVIELGCGPGYFVEEFAQRGKRAIGLDIAPKMVEYTGKKLARKNLKAELLVGDMLDYSISAPVDMALLMMDSVSHILTPEDFIGHLKSVAGNLTDSGIYFIEFSHPGDDLKNDKRAKNSWKMERDGIIVETTWGLPGDFTDPITQVTDTTITMDISENGKTFGIRNNFPQRFYMAQEVLAYVKLSRAFEFMEWYGGFDINQPFDNSKKSWRMNVVLKKADKDISF